MNPISICKFDRLTSTDPYNHELSLEQLVEFFTYREPPTVTKEQRGPLFSMVAYKPDTVRGKENVEVLSCIVLDFDNTKDGQLKLPDFIKQLKQLDLIYLYYTTWSHTEARHRWRLILPFEKAVAAHLWRDVHNRVLKLLGNPMGLDEAASRDIARMWFMPCKAANSPYDVGYSLHGKFLDPHTLPPMPQTTLPVVIPSESPEATSASIRDALKCIDANCDHQTWLEIGMALHDELGNGGFQIWDSWSSRGGKKYKGTKDLQYKWNSFTSGNGIRIATLFKHAKDGGWQPTSTSKSRNYRITTEAQTSVTEVTDEVTEDLEEAEEFVDPIEKCMAELLPYAVSDIFDFPCALLKSTYDWIQSVAPVPIPICSLSASLSLMAFLTKHRIGTTNLKTNMYILVIGPSRSGKNNGRESISKILKALDKRGSLASAIGSAQGLLDALCQKESCVYWAQDEIGSLFKGFQNKNAGTHETRLEQQLLTLYNCSYITTDKIKGEEIKEIENPYLNVYGLTTENIIDKISPDAAVSGLLARFLVFWYKPDGAEQPYRGELDEGIPQDLLDKLKAVSEPIRSIARIGLDSEATEWFKIFCTTVHHAKHQLYLNKCKIDSLVGNLREQILKLALIVAKSQRIEVKAENHTVEYDAPIEISLKDIQWATSVALHCLKNNLSIAGMLTENNNEKYINKIVEYLNTHQGKWMRRRDVCRCLRYALNARQLDELLQPFLESQQITKTQSKKGGGTLYRLNSPLNKRKLT